LKNFFITNSEMVQESCQSASGAFGGLEFCMNLPPWISRSSA
jgi:hypothetical protein